MSDSLMLCLSPSDPSPSSEGMEEEEEEEEEAQRRSSCNGAMHVNYQHFQSTQSERENRRRSHLPFRARYGRRWPCRASWSLRYSYREGSPQSLLVGERLPRMCASKRRAKGHARAAQGRGDEESARCAVGWPFMSGGCIHRSHGLPLLSASLSLRG
jgi:hypothetical protein